MARGECTRRGYSFEEFLANSDKVSRHRNRVRKPIEQFEDTHSVSCSSGVTGSSRDGYDSDENSQKSPSSDVSRLGMQVQMMEKMFFNIFTVVSALKSAYMRMQAAHTPYNPQELQLADKAVIAELKKLSELKHAYRDKQAAFSRGHAHDILMQPDNQNSDILMKSYEGTISSLQSDIQTKEAEMDNLKETLAQMTLKKEKLERRVKRLELRIARDTYNMDSPTPQLFESVVQGASEAARSFTKLLISLMKEAQWDLDAASNSIQPGVYYARRAYRRYAFESYVCQRMMNGFENENFSNNGSISSVLDPAQHRYECFSKFLEMRNIDALEFITTYPDCAFAKFCQKKFIDLVHPKMEESFFGNFDHRNLVTNGEHPATHFYQIFLALAKAVWLVHQLAFSFEPTATIFQVNGGTEFSSSYMESIVQGVEVKENSLAAPPKVGFTVMPGFRVEKTVIKCQVYVLPVKVER